jgi:hypothetical protein
MNLTPSPPCAVHTPARTIAHDGHYVVARLTDGREVRCGTGEHTYNGALVRWESAQTAVHEGRAPRIDWFAVRSTADPRWSAAPVMSWTAPELFMVDPDHPKGFTDDDRAAAALGRKHGYSGKRNPEQAGGFIGRQGSGGWIYRNGKPVCQGWGYLASRWTREGKIRRIDGRWYLLEGAMP